MIRNRPSTKSDKHIKGGGFKKIRRVRTRTLELTKCPIIQASTCAAAYRTPERSVVAAAAAVAASAAALGPEDGGGG